MKLKFYLESLSIKKRLVWISIITGMIFLITVPVICALIVRSNTLEEKHQLLINTTQVAYGVVDYLGKLQNEGKLTLDQAQNLAKGILTNIRYLDKS